MNEAILTAASDIFSILTIVVLFVGVLWGVILGALPGMGSVLAITICLPFTYALQPNTAIALLLGVYVGSVYGGCISAILINTPGTPQSAATCFDGFPMAKQGKAAEALGWATTASVIGGIFSCLVLIAIGPNLAKFALHFGPVETTALICMAMICIVSVSRDNMFKGLLAGMVGLFLAIVGVDPILGALRFDFGFFVLSSGFDLVAVVVGVFALSEVMARSGEYLDNKTPILPYDGIRFPKLRDVLMRWKVILKSSVIGTGIGILPGTGASVACFISYAEAKRSSPRRDKIGTGEPDGIIAPEAANNAVTGGALIPTLALGLPGDAVTAVMLATLVIHGITPGVRLMTNHPEAVYGAFISLMIGNLFMIPAGLITARLFGRLLRIPEGLLMSGIVILCLLGTYGVRGNNFDLYVTIAAGLFGFIMRQHKVPLAPLVIGLVLGNLLELSLRQGLILTHGSLLQFYTGSVIACILFNITIIMLVFPPLRKLEKMMRGKKNA